MDYNNLFQTVKDALTAADCFRIAKQLCGLTDGQGREHNQPCPFCGGNDRFYFRNDGQTFHCRQCGFSGDIIDLVSKQQNIGKGQAVEQIAERAGIVLPDKRRRQQAATKPPKVCHQTRTFRYCYRDYNGGLSYKKYRREITGKSKTFYFEPKGVSNHFPYGLTKRNVDELQCLFVCEGEKAALRLQGDYVQFAVFMDEDVPLCRATTLDTGSTAASQWQRHINELGLSQNTLIVILPDYDESGEKYGQQTAQIFSEKGFPTKIVRLPDLPPSGDYADWHDSNLVPNNEVDSFVSLTANDY